MLFFCGIPSHQPPSKGHPVPQPDYELRIAQRAEQSARIKKESEQFMDGARAKGNAVMLGILGFFVFGVIFGPMAIMQARKAEKYYGKATFGKVLGWIDIFVGALWIWAFVAFLNGSGHLN